MANKKNRNFQNKLTYCPRKYFTHIPGLSPLWIEASEAIYSRHDCSNERETESWGGERRKGVLRINLSRWNKKTQMAWLAEWMVAQTTDHQRSLNWRKPRCFGPNGQLAASKKFRVWCTAMTNRVETGRPLKIFGSQGRHSGGHFTGAPPLPPRFLFLKIQPRTKPWMPCLLWQPWEK